MGYYQSDIKDLTAKEQKAVIALEKAINNIPDNLVIFVDSCNPLIIKKAEMNNHFKNGGREMYDGFCYAMDCKNIEEGLL